MKFKTAEQAQSASIFLKETTSELLQKVDGAVVSMYFSDAQANKIKRTAVERNVEVLRTRVDKIGVSETPVFVQGDRNIVVELPDVKDPQEAKAIIGKATMRGNGEMPYLSLSIHTGTQLEGQEFLGISGTGP